MPVRHFTDLNQQTWRVWSTMPSEGSASARSYPDGWLTFDCGDATMVRRLAPIPTDWHDATDGRLCALCGAAIQVARRSVRAEQGGSDTAEHALPS